MKRKIIIIAAAVLVAGLFIPIPRAYADGTKSYNAVAYKVVKWNRDYYKGLKFTQTESYRFPYSLKSVDELWEGMVIDPALGVVTGTVSGKSADGFELEVIEGNDDLKENDIAEVVTGEDVSQSVAEDETVTVEYVLAPEVSKDKKIEKVVDIVTTTTEKAKEDVKSTTPVENDYRFNTADTLHYVRINYNDNSSNKSDAVFIKSKSEFDKYLKDNSISPENEYSSYIKELKDKYTEKFFSSDSLVLIMTTEPSGSYYYTGVTLNAEKKQITVKRYRPPVGTSDMASWLIVKELPKDDAIFRCKSSEINVVFEEARVEDTTIKQLPGHIVSDIYVTHIGENISPGLKSEDSKAVKKIIEKYTFKNPGYDNISDVKIDINFGSKTYYYDSAGGILTVNGKGVNSDKAVKLSESDRTALNKILSDYIELGVIA